MVVGSPRSGTTWLGKILDSHPNVLYRHEPDSVVRPKALELFLTEPYTAKDAELARQYLSVWRTVRTVKVVGTDPVFSKKYSSGASLATRRAILMGYKLAERAPFIGSYVGRTPLPGFGAHTDKSFLVMKSIQALGQVGLFLSAMPSLKAVVILRHPCGHVASTIRGIKLGKFVSRVPITEDMGYYALLAKTPAAKALKLDISAFKDMTPIERLTWRWAICNTIAMEAVGDSDRARIIRYEDLCENPFDIAKSVFQFSELSWNRQTDLFVNASIKSSGPERYYQVFRDPVKSSQKWREELPGGDIDRIMSIAMSTPAGRLFDD